MVTQNKTKIVGLGKMRKTTRKMAEKGWRIKTTAPLLPGVIWVTFEREVPGQHRADPFGPDPNN